MGLSVEVVLNLSNLGPSLVSRVHSRYSLGGRWETDLRWRTKRQPWRELGLETCKQKRCRAWRVQHPWGRQEPGVRWGERSQRWAVRDTPGQKDSCWRCGARQQGLSGELGVWCPYSFVQQLAAGWFNNENLSSNLQPLWWLYAPRTREQVPKRQEQELLGSAGVGKVCLCPQAPLLLDKNENKIGLDVVPSWLGKRVKRWCADSFVF